jgi:hypothetical protein
VASKLVFFDHLLWGDIPLGIDYMEFTIGNFVIFVYENVVGTI